eukprot:TRINITY_DN48730_c0_g1_i1.p1 TRINITY_DN48730_c0_g1~~TRINITY_DN48730_c0_g1_i1.p1  ORF type:complete len:365 (+),score=35.76 TRINITY_DN48730_c0_g1_i1:60-1097(+)
MESNDAMCRRVKAQFRELDNGMGVVSKSKFGKLLDGIKDRVPGLGLDNVIMQLDLDANGVIDFDEFMNWAFDGGDGERALRAAWEESGQRKVERLFDRWDRDGDDSLSQDELALMLRSLDANLWTDERISELFEVVDKDHSGTISFHEFLDWAFADSSESDVVQIALDPAEAARRRTVVELSPVVVEPPGGEHTGVVVVSMYSSSLGVKIHYTLDGSEPTESSPLYSGHVALDWTCGDFVFVKAFAVSDDTSINATDVTTATYRIAPPPVRFEVAPRGGRLALIASAGVDSVQYTLDGSEPTESSPIYTSPIPFGDIESSVSAVAVCGSRRSAIATWRSQESDDS